MTPKKTAVLRVCVLRFRYPFVVKDMRYWHRHLRIRTEHFPGDHCQFRQNRCGENLDRRLGACCAFPSLNIWRWFICLKIDGIGRRQRYILGPKHKNISKGGAIESLAYRAVAEDTEQRFTIRLKAGSSTGAGAFHENTGRCCKRAINTPLAVPQIA